MGEDTSNLNVLGKLETQCSLVDIGDQRSSVLLSRTLNLYTLNQLDQFVERYSVSSFVCVFFFSFCLILY